MSEFPLPVLVHGPIQQRVEAIGQPAAIADTDVETVRHEGL